MIKADQSGGSFERTLVMNKWPEMWSCCSITVGQDIRIICSNTEGAGIGNFGLLTQMEKEENLPRREEEKKKKRWNLLKGSKSSLNTVKEG